jgi:hypothetical protein
LASNRSEYLPASVVEINVRGIRVETHATAAPGSTVARALA